MELKPQSLHTRAALPGGYGVPASLQEPAAPHSWTQPSAACSTDVWGWDSLWAGGVLCPGGGLAAFPASAY